MEAGATINKVTVVKERWCRVAPVVAKLTKKKSHVRLGSPLADIPVDSGGVAMEPSATLVVVGWRSTGNARE